jgi:hypothetical protein
MNIDCINSYKVVETGDCLLNEILSEAKDDRCSYRIWGNKAARFKEIVSSDKICFKRAALFPHVTPKPTVILNGAKRNEGSLSPARVQMKRNEGSLSPGRVQMKWNEGSLS